MTMSAIAECLFHPVYFNGAEEEIRTPDPLLGKEMLYH